MVEGQNMLRPDEFTISGLILMNGWGLTGRGSIVSEVESLSIGQAELSIPISLRGSLASRYYELMSNSSKHEAVQFIRELLYSNDGDLLKFRDGQRIVIGLCSEKGMYFPDW